MAKYYPRPKHGRIIEPFAGSAQYALRYWNHDVLLVDKYELIIKLWKWLQIVDEGYIRNLPRLKTGQSVDEFTWDCEEAKWLVGMQIAASVASPRKRATSYTGTDSIRPNRQNYRLNLVADNLKHIRHWEIRQGDYKDIPNEEASWFIDPPYQKAGSFYVYGSQDIDYNFLAQWCRARAGQVIVCEDSTADWLPFCPVRAIRGVKHTNTEAMWCNQPHDYQAKQLCFA